MERLLCDATIVDTLFDDACAGGDALHDVIAGVCLCCDMIAIGMLLKDVGSGNDMLKSVTAVDMLLRDVRAIDRLLENVAEGMLGRGLWLITAKTGISWLQAPM